MEADGEKEQERESVCRLHGETEAVDYHCAWCSKKIGDYEAMLKIGKIDKYDRVYCSDDCSMKAFMHPSRDYEARGGDY